MKPQWWVEGAEGIIAVAKKMRVDLEGVSPDAAGIKALHHKLKARGGVASHRLSEDCRKMLEWEDGGR